VGDTGSVVGPATQSLVADKMVTDFNEANAADVPAFLFHLGDVVYFFGEATYYYDQFYEPYRDYPAPILAIPGNHAVFSGHAHNYQRYTRTVNKMQIPFLVAGCGGHSPLSPMRATFRTPFVIDNTLTLESYDTKDYGYLRVIVNASEMTIEFHPQSDGGTTKTPNDTITITLATHVMS
jgi:hypothetical protein